MGLKDNAVVGLVRDALASRQDRPRGPLANSHSIEDLRRRAKKRLPTAVFDYLDGGAEDEVTLRGNRAAFDDLALVPRVMRDVSNIDMATTVGPCELEWPVVCAPTGFTRMFHPDGERAVARAAKAAGCAYCLSTMGTTSIEDVAAASDGPLWFQLYVWNDRDLCDELVARAKAATYEVLCLTVDAPVLGRRERDLRNGLTIPPKANLRTILDGARRPQWWWGFLRSEELTFANVAGHAPEGTGSRGVANYLNSNFDPSLNWDHAARVAEQWRGPWAIKGIQCGEDAARAVDLGAQIVIVSNHGGRQLDHSRPSLNVVPEVVDAVGDRAAVMMDGGIRRGTDIVKALALGADAVMIGRPYLYGLAVGGEAGVARALAMLRTELASAMALTGARSVKEISAEMVTAIRTGG